MASFDAKMNAEGHKVEEVQGPRIHARIAVTVTLEMASARAQLVGQGE